MSGGACDRDDAARLAAGDDDPHVAGCAACTEAWRRYARISSVLPSVGAEHAPRAGWEARVLLEVDATSRAPRWWWFAAPVAAIALAAAALLLVRGAGSSAPPRLALAVAHTGAIVRTTDATVGDRVTVSASGGRALWIYRDDHALVLACPGGASCTGDGAAVTLDTPGRYTFVLLIGGSGALPAPTGDLDADVAAALAAGATRKVAELVVR